MSPQAVTTEDVKESKEKRQLRLVRLRALIQQASEQGGDGQLAAWRACAVIRKFGLDVVDPELVDDLHKEIHTLRQQLEAAKAGDSDPDFVTGFQPPHSHLHTQHYGTYATQSHYRAPTSASVHSSVNWPPASWPQQAAAPPPPPPVTGPGGSPMTAPALIAASKFAGTCKHCRKVINVGDPCRWLKSVGVWCATTSCYSDWLHNQQSAGSFTSPFSTP